jgi:hypothetical protein
MAAVTVKSHVLRALKRQIKAGRVKLADIKISAYKKEVEKT